ncbi:MAG TPA: hypothetical protein VHP83_19630 [Aggregatilineaceae bacterium]|nr:hypothetical protein [Aggregatilineaceae bacterium]
MGSTLIIRENAVWMPTSADFDWALEIIAGELEKDTPLQALFLEEYPFPFLDLSQLETTEFRQLIPATQRAYNTGAKGDSEPLRAFNLMARFSELKGLIVTDPRALSSPNGTITVSSEHIWEAAGWIRDLILENIAMHPAVQDDHLTPLLLDARSRDNLDLRQIRHEDFRRIAEALHWAHRFYVERQVRISYAPDFYGALSPKIAELYALVVDARHPID